MFKKESGLYIYFEEEFQDALDLIFKLYTEDKNGKLRVILPTFPEVRELVDKLIIKYPSIDIKREIDCFSIRSSDYIFQAIGDGMKIRGTRCNKLIVYNYESMPKDILDDVIRGFMVCQNNPINWIKG